MKFRTDVEIMNNAHDFCRNEAEHDLIDWFTKENFGASTLYHMMLDMNVSTRFDSIIEELEDKALYGSDLPLPMNYLTTEFDINMIEPEQMKYLRFVPVPTIDDVPEYYHSLVSDHETAEELSDLLQTPVPLSDTSTEEIRLHEDDCLYLYSRKAGTFTMVTVNPYIASISNYL